MWQNSPGASRSPYVQKLKDFMVKPVSDPSPVGKGADLDAETDVMDSELDADSDVSSDAIPDCFFGVIDEPQIESNEEVQASIDLFRVIFKVEYRKLVYTVNKQIYTYIYILYYRMWVLYRGIINCDIMLSDLIWKTIKKALGNTWVLTVSFSKPAQDSDIDSDIWAHDEMLVEDDESTGPVPVADGQVVPVVDSPGDAREHHAQMRNWVFWNKYT